MSEETLGFLAEEAAEFAELQGSDEGGTDDGSQENDVTDDSGSEETTETDKSDDSTSSEDTETGGEGETDTDTDKGEGEAETDTEAVDKDKKAETDSDSDSETEDGKPPKGFVPHGALAEERGKRQDVERNLQDAQLKIEALTKQLSEGVKGKGEDEFKILSDDEYRDLLEEDPDEAAMYQHRLINHQGKIREKAELDKQQREAEAYNQQIITTALEECHQIVSTPERASELVQTGVKNGLDEGLIRILTTPEAKITIPVGEGSEQTFLVGKGAVQMVGLLNTLHENNPEKIREQIRKEETERITSEVTETLMKKFKNPESESFVSLEDGHTTSGDMKVTDTSKMTEEQWANLPESERRKLLGG